jgi:parallel beta-helix repeat protein
VNGGASWNRVTDIDWPEALYNVQIATVPDIDDPNAQYVYLLGLDMSNPASPQVYSPWAYLDADNDFTWASSGPGDIAAGTALRPNYPWDIMSLGFADGGLAIILFCATNEAVYYAEHNPRSQDPNIPWVERMGTGEMIMRTKGFRKLAWQEPIGPVLAAIAVAGEECSYYSDNLGLTWTPILNGPYGDEVSDLIVYPTGGVKQCAGSAMVALHSRLPFSATQAYSSVFSQVSPHQSGATATGGFGETSHVGFTWDRENIYLAVDNDAEQSYAYAAFADAAFAESALVTEGIVYTSMDDGTMWNPGTWPNHVFAIEGDGSPSPSDLFVHPTLHHVYISFRNAGMGNGSGLVPPFAFSDDHGATWQVPTNANLPTGLGDRHVVASSSGISNTIYLSVNAAMTASLWASDNDGETWSEIPIPVPPSGDYCISSLTTLPGRPNHVAIGMNCEGADKVCVTNNRGATWTANPFAWEDLELENIWGDPYYSNALWATSRDPNPSAFEGEYLFLTWNGGHEWWGGLDWSWSRRVHQGGPGASQVFVEVDPVGPWTMWPATERVIWTGTASDGTTYLPRGLNSPSGVRYHEYRVMPLPDVPQTCVISDGPPVYIFETTTIPAGITLTIEPGVEFKFAPSCALTVEGALIAAGQSVNNIRFSSLDSSGSALPWHGIEVTGSISLSNCTIEGAVTAVTSEKAKEVRIENCVIQNNETGLDLYAPAGTGNPEISGCTVVDNQGRGIVLTGTESATIMQCQINHNVEEGVLLIDSYAKLLENQIRENGGYGLECLGSSPLLYCNNFQNNGVGEMGLFKESYPVLWAEGYGVGANSFMNDAQTLITMESSAPIVVKGRNDFYLGAYGYFMADLSEKPVKHDLSDNYWNPELKLELLYPSDPNVWTWGGVAESPSNCGTPKGELMGLAGSLFEDGFAAEMSGDIGLAQTKYTQLLTQYPDSAWSMIAAARLFETQRHLDSAYTTLKAFYDTLASNHSEDTLLANAAQALATRLWVEDGQFDPALVTYQQVMQNPPSSVDSVYAALDYSVTALRAQIEDSGGNLDSYVPSVSAMSIRHLVGLVRTTLPTPPPIHHEGYRLPPSNFVLAQNYPNPFNAVTTIRYYLPEASRVTLEVYNITGQHVATLTDGVESNGYHVVHWDASSVASGVYVYQIRAGSFVDSKKMMLIR